MVTNVYAVFDVKSDTYASPFTMPRDGMALRAFYDLAKDPATTVSRHPQDYKLVHLGTYDDETGDIVPLTPHRSLGFAAELLTKEN